MGPTLAAAADTCVARVANRRRAPNTRSSLSWQVGALLARLRGSGSVGVAGRGGGLLLVSSSSTDPGVSVGRLFGVVAGRAQALPVDLVGGPRSWWARRWSSAAPGRRTTACGRLDPDGIRPTHLAERALMTPQAMSELVEHLVSHGYLERMPEPSDPRAKLIVLTDLGYEALQDAFDTIIGIEADLEVLLGRDGLVQFRRS